MRRRGKIRLFLVIVLLVAGVTFVIKHNDGDQSDTVFAKQEETISIDGIADPGVLPSSPVYFLKGWGRDIRLFSSFNASGKAELALKFASEDVLAIKKLYDKEQYIPGSKHCREFQKDFQDSLEWTAEAWVKGEDLEEFLHSLKEVYLCQMQVLAGIVEEAPDWAVEGVMVAIENSNSSLEDTIGQIQGEEEKTQFRDELELRLSDVDGEVRATIRERLGLATGNTVKVYITVSGPADNQPPDISLEAEMDTVAPSDSCRIECSAQDADGDELSYEWSAEEGDISGEGTDIIWTAPDEEDTYEITVVVSDGRGGQATGTLSIDVELPDPPRIRELVVTPNTPKYFQELLYANMYEILQNKSCEIECVVKNSGGRLNYEWEAERGEISGTGSVIRWDAPQGKGEVTVRVTVSNSLGDTDTQCLIFQISNCPSCWH